MVNFGEPATVPPRYAGRTLYRHNPQVTLMRTNPEECAQLGRILAEKLNRYRGPVTVLLPLGGISVISPDGEWLEFHKAPEVYCTNIAFGGRGLRKAFITLSGFGTLLEVDWPRPGLRLHGQTVPV